MRRCLVLAALSLCPARVALLAQSLDVDRALAVRAFADCVPLALSPDGRLVAYTLSDPRHVAGGAASRYFTPSGASGQQRGDVVLVADVRTGATRTLSAGRGVSWGPVWSPDGRRLAFYSDRDGLARVWLWDRDRGTLRRVAAAVVRAAFGFEQIRWSPAGDRLLVKLLPEGETVASAARLLPANDPVPNGAGTPRRDTVTARVYAALSDPAPDGAAAAARAVDVDHARSFMNAALADLAIVDVATGRVRRIARRVRPMLYRFSPDGASVLLVSRHPYDARGQLVWSLYETSVLDTLGRMRRRLPPVTQAYGLGASWSPDGRRIVLADADTLRVVAADGGAERARLARAATSLADDYRSPRWLGPDTIVVATRDTLWRVPVDGAPLGTAAPAGAQLLGVVAPPDAERLAGGALLVVTRDRATKRIALRRLDLGTGAWTSLFARDVALAEDLPYAVDVSRDGRVVAFVAESGDHPGAVWVAEGDLASPGRVSDPSADVTRLALGTTRLVRWTTVRGDTLRGALLLPSDYVAGRRYPLIVRVYGGASLSGTVNRFGLMAGVDDHRIFATRGYAVFLPDAPLRVGTPLADLAADVLPGVDSVIASGIADPDRLGLIGHSHGGWSVLALLVQTGRFRAAIASGSMSDLFADYAHMRPDGSAPSIGWAERDQGRMGATPWEARDRYLANSPFFFLDRVTTPLLLVHGAADNTVPVALAEETFVALRRLGKPVVLVEYDGEEHHQAGWRVANVHDYWARVLDWFGHYLAPTRVVGRTPEGR